MSSKHPRILIAVPMLHDVKAQFFTSFMSLQNKYPISVAVEIGSLVYMARNKLALKAVQGGFDYIVWLDSDMVFGPDTVNRLMEDARKGADFVSGLYFRRSLPTEPVISKDVIWERGDNGVIRHAAPAYADYPRDSVFEIGGAGLGCAVTRTEIITDMVDKYRQPPFDPMPSLGEDYSFCWRLKQMGVKMYCDSRIKVGHAGELVYDEELYLHTREAKQDE